MNKSMVIGLVAGIGVATAGAVAGFAFRDKPAEKDVPTATRAAKVVEQECWDHAVVTVIDPKDKHRIAGTAVGAVVGGAVGKDVGDRDITTAAGAAAGALIGRKVQEEFQENREEKRTVTTIERRCGPVGTPHN